MEYSSGQKTVVVGAGPVGALAAIYAARRGDDVEVYELRDDLRHESTMPLNFTKSINLALSERGINSIRHAGGSSLLREVLNETIPMHGRMIHGRDSHGRLTEQPQVYDVHGRSIKAIDRAGLNKRLLDELESLPNVKLLFNCKLTGANFDKCLAWFETKSSAKAEKRNPEIEIAFDFLIGADGAHSATRHHLMKYTRMDFKQEYIDTLWCEFQIPPHTNQTFKISPNHLHIWPAGDSMFIAIPDSNKSFTCTLFLSARIFAQLESRDDASLLSFFDTHFPGVAPDLITSEDLYSQFSRNPHLPLVSIKCSPHTYSSSCVILGDAAHAMVPFYGQGMNAGMEDVRVLFEFLDKHNSSTNKDIDSRRAARKAALDEYSAQRTIDAATINDLALQNYKEMRSSVRSPIYKARKWLEEKVDLYLPALGWATQYSRISFSNQRYSEVKTAVNQQSQRLLVLLGIVGIQTVLGAALLYRSRSPAEGGRLITRQLAAIFRTR